MEDLRMGRIDIWWTIDDGGLGLLIAHLLQKAKQWRKCTLRVIVVTTDTEDETLVNFKNILHKIRHELRMNFEATVLRVSPINDVAPSAINPSTPRGFGDATPNGEFSAVEKPPATFAALAPKGSVDLGEKSAPGTFVGTLAALAPKGSIDLGSASSDSAAGATGERPSVSVRPSCLRPSVDQPTAGEANQSVPQLSELMRSVSSDASLVIMELPPRLAVRGTTLEAPTEWLQRVETLTESFTTVLFMRSMGVPLVSIEG